MIDYLFTICILLGMVAHGFKGWLYEVFLGDPELGNEDAFDIPANKVSWWFI